MRNALKSVCNKGKKDGTCLLCKKLIHLPGCKEVREVEEEKKRKDKRK
jgi:hypothetical protein